MNPRAASRVAVVTGAGSGLGAEVAWRLAAGGQAVACVDIDGDAAETTSERIRSAGVRSQSFDIDVSEEHAVSELAEAIPRQLGRVRSLINVAGILDRSCVTDSAPATWRRVLDTNLTGPYLLIRAFADQLRAADAGRVVNCSSISAGVGYPFAAYAASKAALSNLTKSALFDFWGTSVTVNAVCPGAMDTPMLDRDSADRMAARTPSGRIASTGDVCAAIEFLNSAAARSVNGVELVIDGGATAVFSYEL